MMSAGVTERAPEPDSSKAPAPGEHAHRLLVPILLALATLALVGGALAVWVNRQALNTQNWANTSRELLANEQIDNALGGYLVNQVFSNTDVAGAIQQKLPAELQGLAGPASAGLKELANRAAPQLLQNPKVQDIWVQANTAAHKQLVRIINGGGPVVSTGGGVVTLNLHELVNQLASELGVQSQVAALQSKLEGPGGAQLRAQAQQRLSVTLPPTSGQLVIMRSDELKTAQDAARAVKSLAIVLPALSIVLFASAVWLARGRRRHALRTTGWCFVLAGVLLLIVRRVAGDQIVDSLVKVESNKPAVHEVWSIATSLLYAIAVAVIVYGIIFALAAWLGGPTRPARFLRQLLAPILRQSPIAAYAAAGGVLLLLILWGPTPAFRQIAWIAVFAALLALGVAVLRHETALEFPNAQRGDALRQLRAGRDAARARKAAAAAVAAREASVAAPQAGGASEPSAATSRSSTGGARLGDDTRARPS